MAFVSKGKGWIGYGVREWRGEGGGRVGEHFVGEHYIYSYVLVYFCVKNS